jgi:hypothetical protein
MLHVADASVHYLEAVSGRACGEIIPFDKRCTIASQGSFASRRNSARATADDQHVE